MVPASNQKLSLSINSISKSEFLKYILLISVISNSPLLDGFKFFNEVKDNIDVNRVLYTGYLPDHRNLTKLMQLATVQVYLTYPFVLSWSLLESLSCGLLVIGSDTGPVREVITDGENGLLVDFFDYENISKKVNEVFTNPNQFESIRKNARKRMIENYDLEKICLPKTLELINDILEGKDGS